MLVLSRKLNEAIIIDGGIRIMVVAIRGNQIRLGFEAPHGVRIYREELCVPSRAVDKENTPSSASDSCGSLRG
jgi:carbon storage regulator